MGKTLDDLIILENFQALKCKIVVCSLGFFDFKFSLRINPLTFFGKVYIKEIYALSKVKSGYFGTNWEAWMTKGSALEFDIHQGIEILHLIS